jgi:2-alkyl-3-oxoalkanoate reductase
MILVTGANGWIAGRVLAHLGDAGRATTADTRDASAIAADARGCDGIIHLAFKNVDHDATGFQANIDGTREVADVAASLGIPLVSLSTAGVYGHAPHPAADEDTPLAPDTASSRARAQVDTDLLRRRAAGQPVSIVRHRFVVGPGDAAVVPTLHRAVTRSPVWVDGGRARLSLIHVDDLAQILARAARWADPAPPVMHATDGAPVTLRDLAGRLVARFGGQTPRFSVPLAALLGPVRAWEAFAGVDPEVSRAPITSMRLRLVGQDQVFLNDRLRAWWPTLTPRSLDEALDAYPPPPAPATPTTPR